MNHQISAAPDIADSPEVEALHTALDTLPEHYRAPLMLYYFGGLNQQETAQALGTPAGTIASSLARGLEQLRDKLGRLGFAVTSAGLLALLTGLPAHAAPAALKASLASVASERFVAAARQLSHRMLAKKASFLATGSGIFKAAAVVALVVAAAVALTRPTSAGAPIRTMNPEFGLIGHWKLDETGGSTATDSSGHGFHGTLADRSMPLWTTGAVGGALDFDGISQAVIVGPSPALDDLTRYTIAAWIKPRGFGQETPGPVGPVRLGRILNKRSIDGVTAARTGWSLFLTGPRDEGSLSNTFCFNQAYSAEDGSWGAPDNAIVLGVWQHVALAYDNSSDANSPVFYLNGKPVATRVSTAPAGSAIPDATVTLSIGNTSARDRAFDGAIDDVRLYNRILSASEIGALAMVKPTARR
jgi:hypothetical protein